MRAHARGEDATVVGQDLPRHPVGAQRPGQGVTHRMRGRALDDLGEHAEPGVVVDAGDDEDADAAGQLKAHEVQLPQIHGSVALPAPVVLSLPAGDAADQAVADERPVDAGPPGHRVDAFPAELVGDARRAPLGVVMAQGHDPRFDGRAHLVGAGGGAMAAVGQGCHPALEVAADPFVHGLASDPVAGRHLDDRQVVADDLVHGFIALVHDAELHEHSPEPPPLDGRGEGWAAVSPIRRICRASAGAQTASIYRTRTITISSAVMEK